MKNSNFKKGQILLGIGILLLVFPLSAKYFFNITDSVRGLLMGIGIALEILGIIHILKQKQKNVPKKAE